jgi:hypothetical protein
MKYRQNREIAWRAIEGEAVLFDTARGMMRQLNPLATALWERLENEQTLADLVAFVVARYEIDATRAQADVETFLQSLSERSLVEAFAE